MEDKELIQKYLEGDKEAYGVLVKKFKTKVFNLAYSMTHDREVADDLAQEIFIKVYFSLKTFQFKSKFGTWLYRVAINHIRDFLRKKGRIKHVSLENIVERPMIQEDETVIREKESQEEQRRDLVYKVLGTLPEKYRMILTLRDMQGISYRDITKILSIAPGTVDSRLFRARKMLREKLKPFLSQKGGSHEM